MADIALFSYISRDKDHVVANEELSPNAKSLAGLKIKTDMCPVNMTG